MLPPPPSAASVTSLFRSAVALSACNLQKHYSSKICKGMSFRMAVRFEAVLCPESHHTDCMHELSSCFLFLNVLDVVSNLLTFRFIWLLGDLGLVWTWCILGSFDVSWNWRKYAPSCFLFALVAPRSLLFMCVCSPLLHTCLEHSTS